MSRPPSYTIIKTVNGHGKDSYRVRVGRNEWLYCWGLQSGDPEYWSVSGGPRSDSTRFVRLKFAELAAKKHWSQWLAKQTILTEEIFFDPEGRPA
ncbi:hypothetical protein LCGC14_2329720 [marine sediment metagenome]|uniref:Uncharacterized protein n=1 Tax=marine sediment metagenome TaxID=412755 RepID=A0A0F9FA98_9ZZZZ